MTIPVELRRSWLFVGGADGAALADSVTSGADVAIQELEDFTPPARRPEARLLIAETMARWRAAGIVAGVRINRLDGADGPLDLAAAVAAGAELISLPMVAEAAEVGELAQALARLEAEHGHPVGRTEILPCVETAAGLRRTFDICRASSRVCAAIVASEDMGTDLGVERTREGHEMRHVRERFLVDCVAASVVAVDMPYTWTDEAGLRAEIATARSMGFKAKTAVSNRHVEVINEMLTPSSAEAERALRVVNAFEAAQASGAGRAEVDGSLVEVPIYRTAQRAVARARAFNVIKE